MSVHSVIDSIRISEAYSKMASGTTVCESEDGYGRIREYPVLANEDEDVESVPYDASDDGTVDESDEDCHFIISECEGGETLYDSLIDGDVGGFVGRMCRRRRDEFSDEWDSADDIRNHILKVAHSCKPGKCVVINVTRRLPICVKRLTMPSCGRFGEVLEGVGDMTDDEFAKWWESLTTEQREAEIAKLPDHIKNGELSDEDKALAGMSDAEANSGALTTGAGTAGLSYLLRKSVGKKAAAKAATKAAAKAGTKAATKAAAKGVGKSLLKKIPGLGAIAGLGFGIGRLCGRDADGKLSVGKLSNWAKAGGELASGLASTIPVIGTAASAAIDGGLAYSDYKSDVDAAKTKAGQLKDVAENDETRQSASHDEEYPEPSSELFEKKSYDSARRFIRKSVDPYVHGFFSDEDWSNVHRVFKAISDLGVNLNYGTKNDGYYVHGYHQNGNMTPDAKAYEFEIKFTNVAGKKMKVCGQLIASGAGTVEYPLSKYDIIFQLY